MWERKWALLAWKLSSNGLVVDEGVVLVSVVDSRLGVYRTIQEGEETINIKQSSSNTVCMTWQRMLTGL